MFTLARTALLAAAAVGLSAAAARAEIIYGMTAANSQSTAPGVNLVRFDSATPGTRTTVGALSGVVAGHTLREIDFRPLDGTLYAISTNSAFVAQVYTVNLNTGALTAAGASFALPNATNAIVSMDFNPAADRLRIVNTAGQSYRWNPNGNVFVQQDSNTVYAAGDTNTGTAFPYAVAYNNNVPNAAATTLYGWDQASGPFGDSFIQIGGPGGTPSPNLGSTTTILAPSGFRTTGGGIDMDVSGATGIAYTTHDTGASSATMGLYTINLTNGAETLVANYGAGVFIPSISVQPVPEPASLLLCGTAVGGLAQRLRRRKATA